jgi:hypothetical protein
VVKRVAEEKMDAETIKPNANAYKLRDEDEEELVKPGAKKGGKRGSGDHSETKTVSSKSKVTKKE